MFCLLFFFSSSLNDSSGRISSVMMSRLMLNLRDPALVPVPGGNASESCLNLTFVESYYPTELSSTDRWAESSRSHRSRPGHETSEALDLHRPAGELYIYIYMCVFSSQQSNFLTFLGSDIESDRIGV
jgi:hypothetical protein